VKNFFIFPFIFLAGGILLSHYFYINLSIWLSILVLIISVSFRGYISFFIFLVGVLLLGMSVYKNKKLPVFQKDYAYVGCVVRSVPYVSERFTFFKCKVVDSDFDLLKNKQINVFYRKEDRKTFIFSSVHFFARVKSDGKKITAYPYNGFFSVENSRNILYPVYMLKNYLIQNYREKSYSENSYSIGLALIFGEKGYLEDHKESFINAGTSHLLAISGMHVGIIMLIFLFIFSFNRNFSYWITALFLTVYPFFTGLHPPVVRASILGNLYLLSKIKQLKVSPLNLLFFTGFFILVLSPDLLFSVSFQLSFIAVSGLILYSKILNPDTKNRIYRFFYSSFFMSVVAVIFTTPLVLYYFGKFSITTVVATPFLVLLLFPYLFLSVFNIFTFFKLDLSVLLMDLVGEIFLRTNRYFSDLGFIHTGFSPDITDLVIFYAVLLAVFLIKTGIFLKLSLSVLTFFLFLSVSSVKPEYKVFVFKGKNFPDVIVVTPYGECFYTREIRSIFDKNRCKEKIRFGEDIPYDVVSDIKLFKKGRKKVLKIENLYFTLKNSSYSFHPVPVK